MKVKIYATYYLGKESYFSDWESCKKYVSRKPNIHYKKFANKNDATNWIESLKGINTTKKELPNTTKIIIYVDGSFMPVSKYAGWGWVATKNDKELSSDYGLSKKTALSRNIDGEIEATLQAIQWSAKNNLGSVTIAHDYQGIKEWAQNTWKANSQIATYYQKELQQYKLNINFKKITAHSNNYWNDKADELAKKAILETSSK